MTAWVVSRRATVVAVAMVAAAGGVAYAAGGSAPRAATAPPKIISIVPQGAAATTMSDYGPVLSSNSDTSMRVGFVVPPDRTGTKPLKMRVVYMESSAGACSWLARGDGLEGPDGPQSSSNVHNGGWQPPGQTGYSGLVNVSPGAGEAHTAIFKWPFPANPGMFIQFALHRDGADATDTCSDVVVTGLELRY